MNYDNSDGDDGNDKEWCPMDGDELNDEDNEVDLTQGDYDDKVGVVNYLQRVDNILKILDDYQVEGLVLGGAELVNLKRKKRLLVERSNRGYYRCKVRHATVYNEIGEVMQSYQTEE